MEKVKKNLNNFLSDLEKRRIFLVTFIFSLIVHFQLYTLMITGPDTLINSMYHQADVWETMLLRFGLNFVQAMKGNIVAPALVTLISSIFLGLTVILVIDTLEIKNKYFKYITAAIFAVAPNISATLTFFYCSDAYMLGMLFSTLAIFLIRKYENKNWMILISGLLVSLSMGIYQTYLSITMVLCIATLIIDVLNRKELKQVLINIFKYIIMGVISIVLFYTISHLVLFIAKLPVATYNGANTIGIRTILSLPELLPEAYTSFFNYYFNDNMLPNTIWHTNILYIIIFIVMLFSVVYIIIKNSLYKKIPNIIILFIFVIFSPVCFGIIEIMVPNANIHILMACSMIYVFPIFFRILETLPSKNSCRVFKYIVTFCSLIIIWNYTWQDNASYIAIKSMQNQAESLTNRIVTKIESLEEYSKDMQVLILGDFLNNPYFNRQNTDIEAKKIYDRTWGFIAKDPTVWRQNQDSWRKLLYEYLGINMNLVSEWERQEIFETEEYKSMKVYPEKDSIKIINNTVVVRISE